MFIYIDKVHIFEDEEIFIITKNLDKEMNTESMTFSDRLKARGREEGLREGMEKGLEQGLEKGTSRGMQEAKLAFAKKLLDRKFSIQEIVELTGLTSTEVTQIISGEK
jgi:predicted transposase/invertase (TIGR01784 family)